VRKSGMDSVMKRAAPEADDSSMRPEKTFSQTV
jgi:hypothetical protein